MTKRYKVNWLGAQNTQLTDELESVLCYLPREYHFRDLIRSCLDIESQTRPTVHKNSKPWHLLPLIVCESISGTYDRVIPVAAVLYLLRAAAEIFDDIEDTDKVSSLYSRLGPATSLNIGTTIIMLAERAISRLFTVKGIDRIDAARIANLVNMSYIRACFGQHIEFSKRTGKIITESTYIHSIVNKSAGIQCACEVGAILAGARSKTVSSFVSFGKNVSIAAQLANDILGVIDGRDTIGRKISLPVIYSMSVFDKEKKEKMIETYLNRNSALQPEIIKSMLIESGALYYTTVKTELYKQQARNILSHIRNSGISINKLESFV